MVHPGNGETVLAFVALIPDALEFVEVVLDQVIQRGILGVSRPIDSLRMTFHIGSNRLPSLWANLMFGRSWIRRRGDVPYFSSADGFYGSSASVDREQKGEQKRAPALLRDAPRFYLD